MDAEKFYEAMRNPLFKEKEDADKNKSSLLKPKGELYTWDEFIILAEQEPKEAVKLIINAAIKSDTILDRVDIGVIISDRNKDMYRNEEWIGDIYPRVITYLKTTETTKMYSINLYSNICAMWSRGEMDIEGVWPNIFPKDSISKSIKRCMCFIFHVLMHIAFIYLFEAGKDIPTVKECIGVSRHLYNLMGMDYEAEFQKTYAAALLMFIINDLINLDNIKEEK